MAVRFVQFAVVQSDGSPLYGDRRQVTINRNTRNVNGYTQNTEVKMIVRDDGIVHYKFIAEKDAKFIVIRVSRLIRFQYLHHLHWILFKRPCPIY